MGADAETELQLKALDVLSTGPASLAAGEPAGSALARSSTRSMPSILQRYPRSHCRILWQLEEGQDVHYQVEAREERLPFYSSWSPMTSYYRFRKEEKVS